MADGREASGRSPGAANGVRRSGPVSDRERVLLLECRLEQMRSALDAARHEADLVRTTLADVAARESDHVRRYGLVHEELAEARADIAELHRRLERSEALREELAGHLFEGGAREDAEELIRLRQKMLAEDERAVLTDRTVARLRARVEELVSSREVLLTRVAEWQQLIRKGEPEAADLSEFLAELRSEILDLERRNVTSDAREAVLRERLARAGIDPVAVGAPEPEDGAEQGEAETADIAVTQVVEAGAGEADGHDADTAEIDAPGAAAAAFEEAGIEPHTAEADFPHQDESADDEEPAEPVRASDPGEHLDPAAAHAPDTSGPALASRTAALIAELRGTGAAALQADLLLRLGRSGDAGAAAAIRPWTESSEPSVRAATYEALGRLLERSPDALQAHLRAGLGDPDARVRRRVALATATARGLAAHTLLDPLREDPDPQVRRVVRQVLGQARFRGVETEHAEPETPGAHPSRPLATRPSRTVS